MPPGVCVGRSRIRLKCVPPWCPRAHTCIPASRADDEPGAAPLLCVFISLFFTKALGAETILQVWKQRHRDHVICPKSRILQVAQNRISCQCDHPSGPGRSVKPGTGSGGFRSAG